MKKYVFGVDVGGTSVKLGLFDTDGVLLEKWQIPTRVCDDENRILQDIADAVQEKRAERGLKQDEIGGIGMGIPGAVLPDGTVNKCVNLNWGRFQAGAVLEKLTGSPVRIGNDANVAALGELFKGSAAGYTSAVMITLGTGVGAGVIQNGRIVPGAFGAAGEIGHFHMVDGETETCGCGKKGCLEQYVSANGIARLGRRYAEQAGESTILGKNGLIDSIQVFAAAKDGDTAAQQTLESAFDMLGKALAYMACVIDPEVFVIGGGVSNAGEVLRHGVERAYKRYCFHASTDTKIILASLGNDAGIYGACRMAAQIEESYSANERYGGRSVPCDQKADM